MQPEHRIDRHGDIDFSKQEPSFPVRLWNIYPERWCKCRRAAIVGDEITWELDPRGYDLISSYADNPHRQLISAETDGALVAFVRKYGPLSASATIPYGSPASGTEEIWAYRRERDYLGAMARIFEAVEDRSKQRIALANVERITRVWSPTMVDMLYRLQAPESFNTNCALALSNLRKNDTNMPASSDTPEKWCRTASSVAVEIACHDIAMSFDLASTWWPGIVVEKQRGHSALRSRLGLSSLADALWWMLWQDVDRKRPYRFCEECGALIWSDSQHEHKFCSPKCARRRTGREWIRKKRKQKRIAAKKGDERKSRRSRNHSPPA